MILFIILLVVVSVISYCFLKKEFWVNRYGVLAITFITYILITLIVNYSVRNGLDIVHSDYEYMKLYPIPINDSTSTYMVISYDSNKPEFIFKTDTAEFKLSTDLYFVANNTDSAYMFKRKYVYDIDESNIWLDDFTFPRLGKEVVMSLPSHMYDQIPDSLIKSLPYEKL